MPWAGEKSTSGGADLFTALASPRIWSLEGGSSCVFACVCMGMFMCVFVLACTFAYVCLHECVSCAWVCMYVPYMCLVCVHAHVCVCKYMLCMLHACILCACACMCVFVCTVCVCVCLYVCLYVCLICMCLHACVYLNVCVLCVCLHACVLACMSCMYVCMCVHTCVFACAFVYVMFMHFMHVSSVFACMSVRFHICVVVACMCLVCMCLHVCVFVCMRLPGVCVEGSFPRVFFSLLSFFGNSLEEGTTAPCIHPLGPLKQSSPPARCLIEFLELQLRVGGWVSCLASGSNQQGAEKGLSTLQRPGHVPGSLTLLAESV